MKISLKFNHSQKSVNNKWNNFFYFLFGCTDPKHFINISPQTRNEIEAFLHALKTWGENIWLNSPSDNNQWNLMGSSNVQNQNWKSLKRWYFKSFMFFSIKKKILIYVSLFSIIIKIRWTIILLGSSPILMYCMIVLCAKMGTFVAFKCNLLDNCIGK